MEVVCLDEKIMEKNMRRVWPATHCPITSKSGQDVIRTVNFNKEFESEGFYWFYNFQAKNFLLIVTDELFNNSELWTNQRREIEFLLHNDKWPKGNRMIDTNLLKALINSSDIPNNPLEKLSEVLYFFKTVSEFFGNVLNVKQNHSYNEDLIKKTGIVNFNELERILDSGIELRLIKDEGRTKSSFPVSLTLKGWEEAEKLQSYKESNIAFIAMSFDSDMIKVYNESIEPAIRECGFEPYIVFNQHPESYVTINDAILAGIKKAKFTIADFTHHKSGVYFEAGYALGRGQKVIYTCQEDHIGTAHFDTRNYQHLVWKNSEDLKKKLMDKIEVFIKV